MRLAFSMACMCCVNAFFVFTEVAEKIGLSRGALLAYRVNAEITPCSSLTRFATIAYQASIPKP